MAIANRYALRPLVLSIAAYMVSPSVMCAQEGSQRAEVDYSGAPVSNVDYSAAMARSGNRFTFQFIPDRYTVPPGTPVSKLLPKPPRFKTIAGPVLSGNLADVP